MRGGGLVPECAMGSCSVATLSQNSIGSYVLLEYLVSSFEDLLDFTVNEAQLPDQRIEFIDSEYSNQGEDL